MLNQADLREGAADTDAVPAAGATDTPVHRDVFCLAAASLRWASLPAVSPARLLPPRKALRPPRRPRGRSPSTIPARTRV